MTDCKHERRLQLPSLPPLTFRGDSISAGRGEITWRLHCADCSAPLNADGTADGAAVAPGYVAGGWASTRDAAEEAAVLTPGAALVDADEALAALEKVHATYAAMRHNLDDVAAERDALRSSEREAVSRAQEMEMRAAERDALQARVRELEAALAAKS